MAAPLSGTVTFVSTDLAGGRQRQLTLIEWRHQQAVDFAGPSTPGRRDVVEARRGLTLEDLRAHREKIMRIAAAHGAANVRVFGSVARGEADRDSDIDLLVDVVADAKGFAYFGLVEDLRRALTAALGADVDIIDSVALRRMREQVLREAVPL